MKHLSDSMAQMISEKLILSGVEVYLGIPNGSLQTTSLSLDGYSEEYNIMVEVFSRIGKLAPAHYEKIANDILKLKLAEDILKVPHKKYVTVCGLEAERYLLGSSWKAFAAKYYNFGVIRIDLDDDNKKMILDAQTRQKEGMRL